MKVLLKRECYFLIKMLLKYKSHIRIIQINVSRIILAHINFRLTREDITARTFRSLRPFDAYERTRGDKTIYFCGWGTRDKDDTSLQFIDNYNFN